MSIDAPLSTRPWDYAESLTHDFVNHEGTLVMEPGKYVEVRGCTAAFEAIDPAVEKIFIFSGEQFVSVYRRTPGGTWACQSPP